MSNRAPIQDFLDGNPDADEPLDGEPCPAWKGGQGRDDAEVGEAGEAAGGGVAIALAFMVGMLFAGLIL